ncbi:MAG: hypothetical protein IAE64_01980 [Flavobacteriales bacterium]|nr:MAG: hypothetical protein F9K28_07250 [Bacteroidota bacterium]KXK34851.1 MAG: hypothetical protein UZ06_CHB003000888 [Chlorobi bacterium OLB6]MBE2265001.1 hypothetical protein [Flavobacteriales bacterium]MBW7854150.1 hypothetical protein [Candidatus Kapabacteria bacterium]MCL4277475.1 hypothetical protein [Ignavibacteria bacterium]
MATTTQELQFTVIPYDVDVRDSGTWLRAAIVLTPRLQDVTSAPTTLASYPDFLDWPESLKKLSFELVVNGTTIPGNELTVIDEQPDSDVWKAVFNENTAVNPHGVGEVWPSYQIISFSPLEVDSALRSTYTKLVQTFTDKTPVFEPPKIANATLKVSQTSQPPLIEALSGIIPSMDQEQQFRNVLNQWEKSGQAATQRAMRNEGNTESRQKRGTGQKERIPIPQKVEQMMFPVPLGEGITPDSKAGSLLMAELYHKARIYPVDTVSGKNRTYRDRRPKIKKPTFDFHQVVGVLREFPVVMRRLGLTIHVEFKAPSSLGNVGKISCNVQWKVAAAIPTTTISPFTRYIFNDSGDKQFWQFLPKPLDGSEIVGPLLCLNNPEHFAVTQIDLDSSALKMLGYIRNILHRYSKTRDTPDAYLSAEPPAIRGTGLQLIRKNRGLKLAKSIIRNSQHWNSLIANNTPVLHADDVMRGYRIDIYDETAGTWQSLMRRNATYTFPLADEPLRSAGISVTDEEGVLTFGASRPPGSEDDPSLQQLYAHEVIAQWEGWSIVAPPIGQFIDNDDQIAPGSNKQKPPADYAYQVESDISIVPKSLPRLRYGRKYRMRARFTDIAGNSAKLSDMNPADFTCATDAVRYVRWDPIGSPTLALRNHPVEGEDIETMVIRNYNASEDDTQVVQTTETCERHFFPPLASVQTAERHGLFDKSPTEEMVGNNTMFDLIRGKEKSLPQRWYTRNENGNLQAEATDNTPPSDPNKKKTAIAYPLVQAGSTEVPYLPDPIARTVTLSNVPGLNTGDIIEINTGGATQATVAIGTSVVTIGFDTFSQWPALSSILLRLAEGNKKPVWEASSKTLTLFLPAGEQAWIQFSSGLGDKDSEAKHNLDLHGHKQTLIDAGLPAVQVHNAGRGLNWLISPARTLHLVHATQKPLKKPEIVKQSLKRRVFGGTDATISFKHIKVDARSTQKIDMFTDWKMWIDDVTKPKPEEVPFSTYFFDQHCEKRTDDVLTTERTQEFGDTKFRRVTFSPLATTRFKEYLPVSLRSNKDNLTRKGPGKEMIIPSTKRPDGVHFLYAVPSFRWVESEKKLVGNVIKSTRKGGGVRVYMNRPWYSSGNGELLGVVLYNSQPFKPSAVNTETDNDDNNNSYKGIKLGLSESGSTGYADKMAGIASILATGKLEIPEELHPFVTQWGLDPIWLSEPTPSDNSPRVPNFRDPALVLPSVSLEEVNPKQRFTVVAFEPKFDEDRKLWYCDIDLDPGESYYPFVRFGLVRVQEHSLADAATGKDVYCSRVTQSTFCQLAPDREAMVRIEDDGKNISIQVTGHTYRTNSVGQLGSEIEVALERRDPGAGSTDLGWTRVTHQRLDRIHAANIWAGMIALKEPIGSTQYRMVITELESFFSDPDDPRRRQTSLGDPKSGQGPITLEVSNRIVYADVLELF